MKRLPWSKIPESRIINSVNMWTVSARLFNDKVRNERICQQPINFEELESLFAVNSCRASSADTSAAGGLATSATGGRAGESPPIGDTLERKKKSDVVSSFVLCLLLYMYTSYAYENNK